MTLSPYSAAVEANDMRFASFRTSVMPSFSFSFRARRPPRFRPGLSSGAGSGFFWRPGGGSCLRAILATTAARSAAPRAPPAAASPKQSMRAASTTFAATWRAA